VCGHCEKRCDGRLIAKILITTIQANLVVKHGEGSTNLPELLLLKFLLLSYHHSHFLAATHIFFHNGLLGGRTFFYSLAVLGLGLIVELYTPHGECE